MENVFKKIGKECEIKRERQKKRKIEKEKKKESNIMQYNYKYNDIIKGKEREQKAATCELYRSM